MRLAAILPTLHEADTLPTLLPALRDEVQEIWVIDGGSRDGTVDVAQRLGAQVRVGPPGRGPQMNLGARASDADIFWFLHADSRVPAGLGLRVIAAASLMPWGCCAVDLLDPDPRLHLTARMMNLRALTVGSCTGDMGIWMTRDFFAEMGGFAEIPLFEDLEFCERARKRAKPVVVEPRLGTSARRWKNLGINRTIGMMWGLRALWHLGVPPETLAGWYRGDGRSPQE